MPRDTRVTAFERTGTRRLRDDHGNGTKTPTPLYKNEKNFNGILRVFLIRAVLEEETETSHKHAKKNSPRVLTTNIS